MAVFDPAFYDPNSQTYTYDPRQGPFFGTQRQTYRYRAYCNISVAGFDVTSKVNPHLVSVKVASGAPMLCDIELDDRDAQLDIPPLQASVTVSLGWVGEELGQVFAGVTSEIQHGFGRKTGGRRMWLHCTGANLYSNIKSPMQDSAGKGADAGKQDGSTQIPLQSWMEQFIGKAGGSLVIAPGLGGKTRDFWSIMNASPMDQAHALAREMGGWMSIDSGTRFLFAQPGLPLAQYGSLVIAKWGDNLISWKVSPITARGTWGGGVQQYFDTSLGQWQSLIQSLAPSGGGGGGISGPVAGLAKYALPHPAPNSGVAEDQNAGAAMNGGLPGTGRIIINGEPACLWNSRIQLIGARPGVDGTYICSNAEHYYSRQGYITICDVMHDMFDGSRGHISVADVTAVLNGQKAGALPPAKPPNSQDDQIAPVPLPGV